MKICASSASGYNAIGARMDSSSSFLKGGVLLALPSAGGGEDEGAGVWASTEAVPARNTSTTTDPQMAMACFIFCTTRLLHGPGRRSGSNTGTDPDAAVMGRSAYVSSLAKLPRPLHGGSS